MSRDENTCKARILLAVWGESFIKQFLEASLPTLLAPGNVPALAEALPLTFVFLTRPTDIPVFEASKAFQQLQQYCAIEFISISDLIQLANHPTTLTYAYDRGVRQTGEAMLQTYFIFLTSDYLMADGSMRGLLRYISQGYSGICAGNFQVTKEKLTPLIQSHLNAETGVMQIPPRKLIEYSLPNLHPISIASFLEQQLVHNYRANRFFVREGNLLAGRFYLLHMLCIKPETMDYRIGSSCDYSFISEMCPSGNIGIINDSDDYLVVEAQSDHHELDNIAWGSYLTKNLVKGLAEWTTERHRLNVNTTIYFHQHDLTSEQMAAVDSKLEKSLGNINQKLNQISPQPYYNHPYWIYTANTFKLGKEATNPAEYINYLVVTGYSRVRQLYHKFYGVPPQVYPWHYRWLEFKLVTKKITKFMRNKAGETLILYSSYDKDFQRYRNWLGNEYKTTHHYYLPLWKNQSPQHKTDYQQCIVIVDLQQMKEIDETLTQLQSQLAKNAEILLMVVNEKNMRGMHFARELLSCIPKIINQKYKISDVTSINSNASLLGVLTVEQVYLKYANNRNMRLLTYGLLFLPSLFLMFFMNWFGRWFVNMGHCTDVMMTITFDEAHQHG